MLCHSVPLSGFLRLSVFLAIYLSASLRVSGDLSVVCDCLSIWLSISLSTCLFIVPSINCYLLIWLPTCFIYLSTAICQPIYLLFTILSLSVHASIPPLCAPASALRRRPQQEIFSSSRKEGFWRLFSSARVSSNVTHARPQPPHALACLPGYRARPRPRPPCYARFAPSPLVAVRSTGFSLSAFREFRILFHLFFYRPVSLVFAFFSLLSLCFTFSLSVCQPLSFLFACISLSLE